MSTYPSLVTSDQSKAEMRTAREQYLACLFISGACNVIYGDMKRYFHNEYLKDKDAYPKTFEWDLKYVNYYQTLNKPGGYKKKHKKNKEVGLVFSHHGGGNTTRGKRNTTKMVNHIVSTVEVKIIGQIIFLNSTRSSKGNCMPNLKTKNQKKNLTVTRLCWHRWPYIKSMMNQMKKTATMSVTNAKQSTHIIFFWVFVRTNTKCWRSQPISIFKISDHLIRPYVETVMQELQCQKIRGVTEIYLYGLCNMG